MNRAIIPLLTALIVAPAAHAADQLSTALECGLPADKALAILHDQHISPGQNVDLPKPVPVYGVPALGIGLGQQGGYVDVSFSIKTADLPAFIRAAKLEKWEDDGAGYGRNLLSDRNSLQAPTPEDAAGADTAEVTCHMAPHK